MRRVIAALLAFFAMVSASRGEQPSDELVKKLKDVIREHCPDAQFELADRTFTAKHGTMMFTLHRRWMTGEISEETNQKEGPNYKGFLLKVTWQQGAPITQPVTPQTLREPYWKTFINDPATEDGKNHYWVAFSYGSRLDEKLKAAILDALPNGRFKHDDSGSSND